MNVSKRQSASINNVSIETGSLDFQVFPNEKRIRT